MYVLSVFVGHLAISIAYVNIALYKPAYQQHPWIPGDETYDVSNAVDGLTLDLRGTGGQCAVSEVRQTAILWVNLTSIHSIHHITIYFMTYNDQWGPNHWLPSRFLGFFLYVSNTTDRLHGTLCFKDINFTRATIPAVFNTTCPVHGQYVIYYNERLKGVTYPDGYSDYVGSDLCEMEVYGCPKDGFYDGAYCCPNENCRNCHLENNTCVNCKAGYQGLMCELKCDKGSFGHNCSETCGHCRHVNQCSDINGTCLTGCDAGYQGNLCKTPCGKGSYGVDCNETCGHCRDVNKCSSINGTCLTGCDAGYEGDMCKAICPYGYFGQGCLTKCIETCTGCNNINGLCDYGCVSGRMGYFCNIGKY